MCQRPILCQNKTTSYYVASSRLLSRSLFLAILDKNAVICLSSLEFAVFSYFRQECRYMFIIIGLVVLLYNSNKTRTRRPDLRGGVPNDVALVHTSLVISR
jgi:hypothetical protein